MNIRSKIWIEVEGEPVFGRGRMMLLSKIAEYGSINQAAKELSISYRKAWGYIKSMEARLGIPLVLRRTGGKDGGGATITKEAERFLTKYQRLEEDLRKIADTRFRKIFG